MSSDELSDSEIDAALALVIFGFDPSDHYPEYSNGVLRKAYRAGWEDRTT
jgi:hypothetical protein